MGRRGLANKKPRRGSRQDAALRRQRLETEHRQDRLPRVRDLQSLELEAKRSLSRLIAELGVG